MAGFALDLQKLIADAIAAYADKQITIAEMTTLVSDVCHTIADALGDFTGTQADYNSFIADCQTVIGDALSKINIPGIPAFVESYVKNSLVAMIGPLLDHLRPVHKMGLLP